MATTMANTTKDDLEELFKAAVLKALDDVMGDLQDSPSITLYGWRDEDLPALLPGIEAHARKVWDRYQGSKARPLTGNGTEPQLTNTEKQS